jgi:hypothetical protein
LTIQAYAEGNGTGDNSRNEQQPTPVAVGVAKGGDEMAAIMVRDQGDGVCAVSIVIGSGFAPMMISASMLASAPQ